MWLGSLESRRDVLYKKVFEFLNLTGKCPRYGHKQPAHPSTPKNGRPPKLICTKNDQPCSQYGPTCLEDWISSCGRIGRPIHFPGGPSLVDSYFPAQHLTVAYVEHRRPSPGRVFLLLGSLSCLWWGFRADPGKDYCVKVSRRKKTGYCTFKNKDYGTWTLMGSKGFLLSLYLSWSSFAISYRAARFSPKPWRFNSSAKASKSRSFSLSGALRSSSMADWGSTLSSTSRASTAIFLAHS